MLGWLPVAAAAAPLFGSEDPLAPVHHALWYHRIITEKAACSVGWSSEAATELGWISVGVDLYPYHPIWIASGGLRRWRSARTARQHLGALHFDDLPSTQEIDEVWSRIRGGTVVGLRWAQDKDDVGAARHVIGTGLHAIQDFYSHSTWIDEPERSAYTWLESKQPPVGLWTGSFADSTSASPRPHGGIRLTAGAILRLPSLFLSPVADALGRTRKTLSAKQSRPVGVRYAGDAGINLDSRWQSLVGTRTRGLPQTQTSDAFDLALSLAERESRNWLQQLDEIMTGDSRSDEFWARVQSEPGGDWTRSYEQASQQPYTFLSAGRYPPHGERDAESWFLRTVIHGKQRERWKARVLNGTGRALDEFTVRAGNAQVRGPLSPEAVQVELSSPSRRTAHVEVHAFRRAPKPELHSLIADSPACGDCVLLRLPGAAAG